MTVLFKPVLKVSLGFHLNFDLILSELMPYLISCPGLSSTKRIKSENLFISPGFCKFNFSKILHIFNTTLIFSISLDQPIL